MSRFEKARMLDRPAGAFMTRQNKISSLKKLLPPLVVVSLLFLPPTAWALDSGADWRNLSPKEKEEVQRNYQRWQNLSPQDKEHLREEWNRWRSLPQDRRDNLRRRYDELRQHRPGNQR